MIIAEWDCSACGTRRGDPHRGACNGKRTGNPYLAIKRVWENPTRTLWDGRNVTHYGSGAKPEPEQYDAHVWALRAVEIARLWGLPASVRVDPMGGQIYVTEASGFSGHRGPDGELVVDSEWSIDDFGRGAEPGQKPRKPLK